MITFYLVPLVSRKAQVSVKPRTIPESEAYTHDIELSWVEGQIGAMPVFTNRQKALDYMRAEGMEPEELVEMTAK